jgi:hypothetical protein
MKMFCVQWFKKFLLDETHIVRDGSPGTMKFFTHDSDQPAWSLEAEKWRKYFLGSPSCGRVGFKYDE